MNYYKGLAVFIDILGTKNKNFDKLYQISKYFHSKIKKIKTSRILSLFTEKYVSSFSDCAYIIYKFKYDISDPKDFQHIVEYCLNDLSQTLTTFTKNGFLFRGGVVYGDVYFDKRYNLLFGSAINEAFLLEREAIMPRIIFSKTIEQNILENMNIEYKDIKQGDNYKLWNSVICLDLYDYRLFFNYLIRNVNNCNNDAFIKIMHKKNIKEKCYNLKNIYEYLDAAESFSMDVIDNCIDNNVIAKHIWQINYLKNMKSYYTDRRNYCVIE